MSFTSRWQTPEDLGDLKNGEDFLHVAENDMETALRLLESTRFCGSAVYAGSACAGTL